MNSSWIGNELLFNCSLCDRGQEGVIKLVCGNGNCFFWLEYRVGLFIFMGGFYLTPVGIMSFMLPAILLRLLFILLRGGNKYASRKKGNDEKGVGWEGDIKIGVAFLFGSIIKNEIASFSFS